MSNNKFDAAFFDPEGKNANQQVDGRYEKRPKARRTIARHTRVRKARRLPLIAQIGAGVLLALVLVVWPVSCAVSGVAYQDCVDAAVQKAGFDAPNAAILEECR